MENQQKGDIFCTVATKAAGTKTMFTYKAKINFPLPEKSESYELKENLCNLTQELLKIDQDLFVNSSKGKGSWTTVQDIPTREMFNKAFSVEQKAQKDK
eukprot:11862230-Ditylum_brightwellii.AAC.1